MLQKRKKVRFNLVDMLIVIFILAIIAAATYFLIGYFKPDANSGNNDFKFKIRIENVNKESWDSLKELGLLNTGTIVKDAVTGEEIGTIYAAEAKESLHYGGLIPDENGYILGTAVSEDEYTVYITISADAEQDNSRKIYKVNHIRMLIGETVHFKIKSFTATAYIVETNISDEPKSP